VKRILVSILVLAAAGLLALGIRNGQAKRKREVAYQAALGSYTQVLKPGMTRKEVEDYFHGQNISFKQMCCVEATELSKRKSWDDLIKIGEEATSWFCSENNVYLAFQFVDDGKQQTNGWKADDFDTLKSITLFHWLEGCI
jgi:hypothetical protein